MRPDEESMYADFEDFDQNVRHTPEEEGILHIEPLAQLPEHHKSGFVNIVGKPNAGKSTLLNALLGEKLAIITPKAQTTRHRILGILNEPDMQIVFSDTPGFIKPNYALQHSMMDFVSEALQDADVLLFVQDVTDPRMSDDLLEKVTRANTQKYLILNKVDIGHPEQTASIVQVLQEKIEFAHIFSISAKTKTGLEPLMATIKAALPEFPPYFDKEALTNRPERFFVSEIIREKIFQTYDKEIPYSTEVVIEEFKEQDHINRIRATIFIERESQKPIIIGTKGEKIKQVGVLARKDIEAFLGKKAYLELFVKVMENWRTDARMLKRLGYKE